MRPLRLTFAISIVALAALGAGCAKQDFTEQRELLELNRAKWTQTAALEYDFYYTHQCVCKFNNQEAIVSVQGQAITSVIDSGKKGQLPFTVQAADYSGTEDKIFYTVDEWFLRIEDALNKRVESIDVEYSERYGAPTHIRIDYSKNSMDDEIDAHLTLPASAISTNTTPSQ